MLRTKRHCADRSRRRASLVGLAIVTAVAAVALAGCGGGGDGDEESGGGGGGTEANVAAATKLAKAGRAEVMSRSLDVAGASWKGPESSPPVLKNKTVAIMPCSLALEVCRFIGKQFQEGAKATMTGMSFLFARLI